MKKLKYLLILIISFSLFSITRCEKTYTIDNLVGTFKGETGTLFTNVSLIITIKNDGTGTFDGNPITVEVHKNRLIIDDNGIRYNLRILSVNGNRLVLFDDTNSWNNNNRKKYYFLKI